MESFDITKFQNSKNRTDRYANRIKKLKNVGKYTKSIEKAVGTAVTTLNSGGSKSFVIYGEPQSGKTEMMIALTAKLLDKGNKIIILLLNDSISLLNQNLERFSNSGISPAPKKFNEILDPSIVIGGQEHIIFSKKNSKDLQKLIDKLNGKDQLVIIDDEADYATPNSKINKNEKTKINDLIGVLLNKHGVYIGVTATPARLDLNNTFDNDSDNWVDFPPHPEYIGYSTFFPISNKTKKSFNLNLIPDDYDSPKYLREALFSFMVNVAYLNIYVNTEAERNYSILIHTSGKKADHSEDHDQVVKIFNKLIQEDKDYKKYVEDIWAVAHSRYNGKQTEITRYIIDNVNRYRLVVMNSDKEKNVVENKTATSPSTLFTVVIGGNIVSRGVTFDNLLSMFFTRDVKHKLQQDTYIQRARMFGSRGSYLEYFELSIPKKLYFDWHKCFIFHMLSLESIKTGNKAPIWLENKRISAVATNSIDRAHVIMDSGEMSFNLFNYTNEIDIIINDGMESLLKLTKLSEKVGVDALPKYLMDYIKIFNTSAASLAIHSSTSIDGYSAKEGLDKDRIIRTRGFISSSTDLMKFPNAIHHIKIFYNKKKKARVFYKYSEIGSIKFLKNIK